MYVVMAAKHSIRSRLQNWIEVSGSNYSVLAEATGIDVGAIRRLAKNQFDRVDCATWEVICDYFQKPLGELFYKANTDENEPL